MAGRGGYQPPARPAAVSGPGRLSRRTDGGPADVARRVDGQPVQVPNVGESPDLQYGDRQRLEAAQRVAKLNQAPSTPAAAPGSQQGVSGRPSGMRLPDWLINMDSNRPDEPVTAGLDMGPGPGSEILANQAPLEDERAVILQALYAQYGNTAALAMLHELRGEAAQAFLPAPVQVPPDLQGA